MYIYEHREVSFRSAKTRSWEKAERVAQAERDLRNPVKVELKRIADQEAEKAAVAAAVLESNTVSVRSRAA
jgi:hypothetical protein